MTPLRMTIYSNELKQEKVMGHMGAGAAAGAAAFAGSGACGGGWQR